MKEFVFEERTKQQISSWFNGKKRQGRMGFLTLVSFQNWYNSQSKKCHYCGIDEKIVQEIVMCGKLTSARFPKKGLKARGRNRGKWLEVDRKKPKGNYTASNCVLACYFCNNDKSDVFNENQYIQFLEDRARFLRKLLA